MSSALPFVVAIGTALLGLAVLVPWLVHESRRPIVWPVVEVEPPRFPHPRLRALMISARCLSITVARRMEPTPDSVVAHWQSSFAVGRSGAVTLAKQASCPTVPGARSEKANGSVPERDAKENQLLASVSFPALHRLDRGNEIGQRVDEASTHVGQRQITTHIEESLIVRIQPVKDGVAANTAVFAAEPKRHGSQKSRWLVAAGAFAVVAAIHLLWSSRRAFTPRAGSRT